MAGQCHHRADVVEIQPRPQALVLAEGEEVLEDFLVGDDAGDDRHQHEHRAEADQVARPQHRDVVQVEVQAVEEISATRLARLQGLAGVRVQRGITKATAPATAGIGQLRRQPPEHLHGRVERLRQGDEPVLGLAGVGLQVVHRTLRGHVDADLVGRQRRAHPAADFLAVVTGGAGHEDQQQQPADQQAGPGVQPGHRLAESVLHAQAPSRRATAAISRVGTRMPAQARSAVRVANAHNAAQAATRIASSRPVSTPPKIAASERDSTPQRGLEKKVRGLAVAGERSTAFLLVSVKRDRRTAARRGWPSLAGHQSQNRCHPSSELPAQRHRHVAWFAPVHAAVETDVVEVLLVQQVVEVGLHAELRRDAVAHEGADQRIAALLDAAIGRHRVVDAVLPVGAAADGQFLQRLRGVAGEQLQRGLRQVGVDVAAVDVLGHVARCAEGGIPARCQLAVHFELEAAADGAPRGNRSEFAGPADDRFIGGLGDVVLLDAEDRQRGIQAIVEPGGLDAHFVALAIHRIELV
ncbi:hypothetical protein G6F57_014283 [Rhizopus arrhizus]|nr:hypothetical protein G6F57_014283 [Rhizopus arrhizus]